MSLIKKIKQFINGSWQEFQLDANNIDNVATREWVTNADKTIVGDTTFNGDILFDGGEIKLTNEVILSGSEIYYDGQYVGDFHPNAPYAYANRQWVESLVTNQVKYLGIVNSVDDITNAFYSSDSALGKAGDFVRAGSSFTIETETVHPGDIIIANNVSLDISLANYDIIHTEDPGNYATLNTDQTITGKKTFTNLAVDQNVMASGIISFRSYYEDPTYPKSNASITVDISPAGLTIVDHQNSRAIYGTRMIKTANSPYGIGIPNADFSGDYFATRNWTTNNTVPSSTIDQEFFNLLY